MRMEMSQGGREGEDGDEDEKASSEERRTMRNRK